VLRAAEGENPRVEAVASLSAGHMQRAQVTRAIQVAEPSSRIQP
jgi:hypothetical protein